jgi:hypothetical protein
MANSENHKNDLAFKIGQKFRPINLYIFALLLTIIFVPVVDLDKTDEFLGWNPIWNMEFDSKIYIEYLIIEIGVISLIFFGYLFNKKKK